MANLMSLVALLTLDKKQYEDGLKESESQAKSFGSSLGKGLGIAAKGAGIALGAAAAGVTALTKSAVENYGEYEQLVGGIETLFGAQGMTIEEYADSVGKSTGEVRDEYNSLIRAQNNMFGQAQKAYKTAGLSANDYMETATSFAASLVSSLGGNTEEAARIADMAIIDMSDNANKMGSDMSMIQSAYQGFAKQNYTMLDNLKLGYGGTKTEMERLISDANKLKEAQGEMADLSIDSYADIVEAIHLVQDEMGITGTTAKEASSTIQGSLSSARGAWQNLLTGIADDNQDFDQLVNNFIDTIVGTVDDAGERVGGVLNNIIPRVQTALEGVTKLIEVGVPELLKVIPPMIENLLPDLVQAASTLVKSFIDVLPDIITTITDMLPDILSTIGQGLIDSMASFTESIPEIAEALSNALGDILVWISDNAGELIGGFASMLSQLLTSGIQILSENSGEIINAFFAVVKAIIQAALENPELIAVVGGMAALKTIGSHIMTTIGSSMAANAGKLGDGVSDAVSKIPTSPGVIGAIVAAALAIGAFLGNELVSSTEAARLADDLSSSIMNISTANDTLKASIDASSSTYESAMSTIDTNASVAEALYKNLEDVISGYDGTVEKKELIKSMVDELNELIPGLGLVWDEYTNSLNKNSLEVMGNIEQMKAQAQAAAAQELYIESVKEAAIAQENYQTSVQNAKDVTEKYGITLQDLAGYIKDGSISGIEMFDVMSKGNVTLGNSYQAWLDLTEAAGGYINAHINLSEAEENEATAMERLTEAQQHSREVYEETGVAMQESTDQITAAIETLGTSWEETLGYKIPEDAAKAAQAAMDAGYQIPEGMVSGIDAGQIAVGDAVDRMNAIVDFEEAVGKANLGGLDVSQSFIDAWLSGAYGAQEASAYYTSFVDFSNAITEAQNSGVEVDAAFVQGLLDSYGLSEVTNASTVLGNTAVPTVEKNVVYETGASVPKDFAEGANDNIGEVENASQNIHDTVTNALDPLPGEMNTAGDESGANLDTAFGSWQSAISGTVDSTYQFFYDTLGTMLPPLMSQWGSDSAQKFNNGLNIWASDISNTANSFSESITVALSSLPGDMEAAGYDGGSGLYNGLASWEGALIAEAEYIAWQISSTIRAAWQSHSPSKLFTNIGESVGQGLEIGIRESGELAVDAAENVAGYVTDAMNINSDVSTGYNTAISPQNAQEQLLSLLMEYLPSIANRAVILDSGEVVGALAPKISDQFQTYDVIEKRGGTAYA